MKKQKFSLVMLLFFVGMSSACNRNTNDIPQTERGTDLSGSPTGTLPTDTQPASGTTNENNNPYSDQRDVPDTVDPSGGAIVTPEHNAGTEIPNEGGEVE